MELVDAAARLEALGNPTRLALFRHLIRAGGPGLAVGQLQARLGTVPSTLSHHLKALVAAGLIVQERQGKQLICRVDYAQMQGLLDFLMAECCAEAPPPPQSGNWE